MLTQKVSFVMFVFMLSLTLLPSRSRALTLPKLQYEKYELPNGLDVILHQDHSIPVVSVNIWYHVGSKNEKRGRTGFAHLFEHMMFQGSQHHDSEYFEPLEKIGGEINGSTTEDRTNYFENIPGNYLELALWLESDRMGFLLPAMTQEKLDNQRDVVKNERRQRTDNQPYAKAYELLTTLLYPADHPYSWPVIGSMEDLSAASIEDVSEFFKTYYTPSNSSLCIAGDFDPATAKQLVEKYFGSIPPGPSVNRLSSWVPELNGVKRMVSQDNVKLPRLYYAWHTPGYYKPGDAEFDLLATVLTSGKTSRLYKALVYDQQIAQDVAAYQASNEISSTFNIVVTAKEGHSLAEIEKAVDAELQKALVNGITAAELSQAQTDWETRFVRQLEQVGNKSDKLNEYNIFLGNPDKFQWDLDRYAKTTVADVQNYVRQYLDMNRRVILHIVPQGELKAATAELDRTKEPEPMTEPAYMPPKIQKAKLSNGLDLLLVEDHKLPLVQANLVIKSGFSADPASLPGIASLTADLLDEGTKSRTALQISDEAKRLGASIGTGSSFDGSTVNLNVLRGNLDPSLELMADMVLDPTFPNQELERRRQNYLGRIQQESKQPLTSAIKTYMRLMYGSNHPYNQPYTGSGTEASIKAITRDDLVNYYKANYYPNNAAIVIAGDITLAEAKQKFEKVFGQWKPGSVNAIRVPAPNALTATQIYILDKPGAAQSVVVLGNLGISRNDPEFDACDVVNNALGGQFGSRINLNLREDKGYTYGARSSFLPFRSPGIFYAYAQVQTDVTKQTLVELKKELTEITASRPLNDKELTDSKNNLIKSFPQQFERLAGIAGELTGMAMYNLPEDEWSGYLGRINAVDGQTAAKVAKDHVHPNALLIVVVGDKEKIEPGIRELNLGEIHYVDAEANIIQ
jgi:zinc protease